MIVIQDVQDEWAFTFLRRPGILYLSPFDWRHNENRFSLDSLHELLHFFRLLRVLRDSACSGSFATTFVGNAALTASQRQNREPFPLTLSTRLYWSQVLFFKSSVWPGRNRTHPILALVSGTQPTAPVRWWVEQMNEEVKALRVF